MATCHSKDMGRGGDVRLKQVYTRVDSEGHKNNILSLTLPRQRIEPRVFASE